MAPSFMGLSMLLFVCSEYRLEHDIKYNSTKSNVMIFCCYRFKYIHILKFVLNGETLPRVNKCKLNTFCILLHTISVTMMTYLGNIRAFILRLMSWSESFTCVQNLSNLLYLNPTVLHYVHSSCCVTIVSIRKRCVAYNTVFR